jgi:glycosyltransferase involved in cell wall biosynthesis
VSPAVSVILPAYNVENHQLFRKAVESVLLQTFFDFELIIVNDGSADNTAGIIKSYQAKDKRVVGVFLEKNGGLPNALNVGIRKARAGLLTWTSSDNFLEPNFLSTFVSVAAEFPESNYYFSDWNMVDEQGDLVVRSHHDYRCPHDVLLGWQGSASFLWRKDAAGAEASFFDTELTGVEDFELWNRIMEGQGSFAPWISMPLYNYTFNHGSWKTMSKNGHIKRMTEMMVEKVMNRHTNYQRTTLRPRLENTGMALSPQLLFPSLRFNYDEVKATAIGYHRLGTRISSDYPGPDGGVRELLRQFLPNHYHRAMSLAPELHSSRTNHIILKLGGGDWEAAGSTLRDWEMSSVINGSIEAVSKITFLKELMNPSAPSSTTVQLEDDTSVFQDESFRRERALARAYNVLNVNKAGIEIEGHRAVVRPYRLAVIPSDPLAAYEEGGYANWLTDYYNPLQFFDEVYVLSPLETTVRTEYGMRIVPTEFQELANRIKELGIHVVRAYGGYWPADMATAGKVNGVPVVVSVHDTNPDMLHLSVKNADYVLPVSKAVANLLVSQNVSESKLFMFSNRVDTKRVFTAPSAAGMDQDGAKERKEKIEALKTMYPGKYRIVSIGRRAMQKNWDTLIKAIKLLGADFALIMIGRGDANPLRNLANELGVAKQVHLVDSIRNDDIPVYHELADVFCTPSRWEGFGIVFIEALASGRSVVVTSDIAPMNEFITNRINGLLVKKYEDEVALKDAIVEGVFNSSLRETILSNAPKSIQRFSKSNVDQWEVQLYRTFLSDVNV